MRKIGFVLKPHGIRGELALFLESDFPDWLCTRSRFFAEVEGALVTWEIERARMHKKQLIIKTSAVKDRDTAERMRKVPLFLPEEEAREAVDDEDYFFHSDLIGLDVLDLHDETPYGKVVDVVEMPTQLLLEIAQDKGKTFLVPFVASLVPEVDVEAGILKVDLPEGLVDCNQEPGS